MTRLQQWIRILSGFVGTQVVIQALSLVSGLILIRYMPVKQYALYTLALSAVSFFAFFCDLGITNSMLFFRRETNGVGSDFSSYVAAAIGLRHKLFIAGAVIVVFAFPYSAIHRGFDPHQVIWVLIAMLFLTWFQVATSIQLLLLRLRGAYSRSYIAEIVSNTVRLIVAFLMLVCGAMISWLGIIGAAVGSLISQRMTRISPFEDRKQGLVTTRHEKQILRYLLPSLPSALYFSIQGPLIVWLTAYFGKIENIAQVGALGRLGLMMSMILGFLGTIVLPRLSAIHADRLYLRRYLQFWLALLAMGICLIVVALSFPQILLWLLGEHYQGLEKEVTIVVAGAIIAVWGAYSVGVNNARGWIRPQVIALLVFVSWQFFLVKNLNLSETHGVFVFGLLTNSMGLILQLTINFLGFFRPRLVSVPKPLPMNAETAVP